MVPVRPHYKKGPVDCYSLWYRYGHTIRKAPWTVAACGTGRPPYKEGHVDCCKDCGTGKATL